MHLAAPFDWVLNLGTCADEPELRAPDDGRVHAVVVLHGLWRTRWSMWRLERTLRQHGYEVWNASYPSTRRTILEHGQALAERIEGWLASRPGEEVALHGVGHSLGGLVLRAYFRRPEARPFRAVVCLGSPHRGSALASHLHGRWYYKLVMGTRAAHDLAPETGVIEELGAAPPNIGNVIGHTKSGRGRRRSIPSDDDGRVGIDEARLDGEADAILLRAGHTALTISGPVIHQVLWFLRHGRFDHQAPA